MNYRRYLVTTVLVLASGRAIGAEPCASHFAVEEDAYLRKTYTTWQVFRDVAPDAAFKRLYRFTAKDGWNITSSDAAAGVISANQPVSGSDGKTVPLNVVVEAQGGGSKVSLIYSTPGGLYSPQDAVLKHFCTMLSQVR